MAAATVSSAGPRYAPEDPTLPKPWKGLVDGKTGYLYFWNPETNVTQYERPVSTSHTVSAPSPKQSAVPVSSSVQVQQSSQTQHTSTNNDGGYGGGVRCGSELASGASGYESAKSGSDHLQNIPNGAVSAGQGVSPEAYCSRHEITVTGSNVPPPFTSFEATGLPAEILREVWISFDFVQLSGEWEPVCDICSKEELNVVRCATMRACIYLECPYKFAPWAKKKRFPPAVACITASIVRSAGFSAPTPIQAQSWPIALQSRDIVAVAKTGSGKTLGYLIPSFVLLKRSRKNPQMGPTVLVLSPTRELATQIQDEAVKFGKSSKISCTCLYGGAPKGPQLRELDRGADIVVATPGRLNDILEMRRVSLGQVSYLVLDEADRMLDMGFEPQIRKIVNEVPARRQTLMYTATWPKEVRKIASDLLVNPVQVNIGNVDELVANKSITQNVEVVPSMEKQRRVEQILRSQEPGSKIIIFCSTKKMCDMLSRNLNRNFGAAAIHGDKSQGERDQVLSQFRTGRCPVLVATDVAARGLDVKDIRVVVNYDFPTGVEDYVHRIGRTGRAGATGIAYTFFGEQDAKHASDLIKILEGANQHVPPEIREMASRGGFGRSRPRWGSGSGYGGRDGGHGYSGSFDREIRDSVDATPAGSFHSRSFHESMGQAAGVKRSRSRSRSPSKWGALQTGARSPSPERSANERAPARSFHELMMQKARS
ncbi:hypothetical protein LguiA_017065 [Lonicera macranthoides]